MLLKSQVKYIQSLGDKKFRDAEGIFVAEGPKIVNEFLTTASMTALDIFATAEWMKLHAGLVSSLSPAHVHVLEPFQLEKISSLQTPNQVLGVFKKPAFTEPFVKNKISLVLDNIQDPGNLGTIVRIADWFDIENVFCSEHCADAFNPKSVQASMGSIARVNISYLDLPSLLRSHPPVPAYATTLEGESVFGMQPIKQAFILVGNESQGLSAALLSLSSHRITIPRFGRAESLNAAVAAGIILSHLVR